MHLRRERVGAVPAGLKGSGAKAFDRAEGGIFYLENFLRNPFFSRAHILQLWPGPSRNPFDFFSSARSPSGGGAAPCALRASASPAEDE